MPLPCHQRDRLADDLQAVVLELGAGTEPVAVELGLGGGDLVEQLALAVLLAGIDVRLADRERLAERPAPLSRGHDQAR